MSLYSLRERLLFIAEGVYGEPPERPWFLRRRAFIIFGIVFAVSVLAGALLCIGSYQHYTRIGIYRWNRILEPLYMLPAIVAMIYALFPLIWLLVFMVKLRTNVLLRIPLVFTAPVFPLETGEKVLFSKGFCIMTSPDGRKRPGRFMFTDRRVVLIPNIAVERVAILLNQPEPDLATIFLFSEIERCGYAMNPEKPKHWTIIHKSRDHYYFMFGPAEKELDVIPEQLGWKRSEIASFKSWSPK